MRLLRIVTLACAVAALRCGKGDVDFYPIAPPAAARGAWWAARACSGVVPTRGGGGELGDVQWFVADLSQVHPHLMGAWLPPDTIVLDLAHVRDSVTIEHELLHHLLRGSVNGEAHPFVPFVWPCHLIGTVGG